jgi:hypothetical protein
LGHRLEARRLEPGLLEPVQVVGLVAGAGQQSGHAVGGLLEGAVDLGPELAERSRPGHGQLERVAQEAESAPVLDLCVAPRTMSGHP